MLHVEHRKQDVSKIQCSTWSIETVTLVIPTGVDADTPALHVMAGLDPAIHAFLETTCIWRRVVNKTGWYKLQRSTWSAPNITLLIHDAPRGAFQT
jgi:hypothetical protein